MNADNVTVTCAVTFHSNLVYNLGEMLIDMHIIGRLACLGKFTAKSCIHLKGRKNVQPQVKTFLVLEEE